MKALLGIFFLSVVSLASAHAEPLQDVPYNFDPAKVAVTKNAFHFLRSFVDLYYLVFKANESSLSTISPLTATQGWCVGDAHPENFGTLLQDNGSPIFSMNDMDDSGPCPIVLDLYRLMVSSRLYDSSTNLDQLRSAYVSGLLRGKYGAPLSVQQMLSKATKKGMVPSDKKVVGNKLVRDPMMTEVTSQDLAQIQQILQSYGNILASGAQLLDAVETSKVGGGSGGMIRYEVLLNNGGNLLHLELKQQVIPSVYPMATTLLATPKRIANALAYEQGAAPSRFYRVVRIGDNDFLIRPRFAGNIGVDLSKQTESENQNIIRYEAYVLGWIHARSIQNTQGWASQISSMSSAGVERDVDAMVDYMTEKFAQLHP